MAFQNNIREDYFMSKTNTHNSASSKKQEGNLGYMARYYDMVMVLLTLGREKTLRGKTLDLAHIKPGDKVLEIGCGTGTLTLAAKTRVGVSGEVVGIDIAPEMIEVARRKAVRKSIDVLFQVGGLENIPFPDNRFDTVMCSLMIFHMPDEVRGKGFKEIYRVLKSGGHLFIIDTVDLRELAPILKKDFFNELEIAKFKLNFMGIWFVRGTAKKT
jgi:ubiquinone/menaquinone biosynthesis C-methylase UbiE